MWQTVCCVQWSWAGKAVCQSPSCWYFAGRRATVMECQYGPRRKGSSGKKAISYEGGGHKMHKLTCPARIYVKKVKKFPGCQIDPTLEGKNVRQAQERALTALRLAGVETGGEERCAQCDIFNMLLSLYHHFSLANRPVTLFEIFTEPKNAPVESIVELFCKMMYSSAIIVIRHICMCVCVFWLGFAWWELVYWLFCSFGKYHITSFHHHIQPFLAIRATPSWLIHSAVCHVRAVHVFSVCHVNFIILWVAIMS